MIQIYYKEHHGYRHYTIVFRRVKGLLNSLGIQVWDITGGTDRVLYDIESLSVGYARLQHIGAYPVGDWTLGKAIKLGEAPKSVRNMAKTFEKAGLIFAKHCRVGDNLHRDFWKYEIFNGE